MSADLQPSAITAEAEERARLDDVQARLRCAIEATETRLGDYVQDIEDQKRYLSENRDEMDHIEKIASRESIDQSVRSGNFLYDKKSISCTWWVEGPVARPNPQ